MALYYNLTDTYQTQNRTMYCLIFNYMKKNEWKDHSGIRLVQNNRDTPRVGPIL